jgi:hypothetical protein
MVGYRKSADGSQPDHYFVRNLAGGSAAEVNIVGDIAANVRASVAISVMNDHVECNKRSMRRTAGFIAPIGPIGRIESDRL